MILPFQKYNKQVLQSEKQKHSIKQKHKYFKQNILKQVDKKQITKIYNSKNKIDV